MSCKARMLVSFNQAAYSSKTSLSSILCICHRPGQSIQQGDDFKPFDIKLTLRFTNYFSNEKQHFDSASASLNASLYLESRKIHAKGSTLWLLKKINKFVLAALESSLPGKKPARTPWTSQKLATLDHECRRG